VSVQSRLPLSLVWVTLISAMPVTGRIVATQVNVPRACIGTSFGHSIVGNAISGWGVSSSRIASWTRASSRTGVTDGVQTDD
jgi:hypothetical protein